MIDNIPEIGSYEGHPVITLDPEAAYPFSFGIVKAKLFIREYHKINGHYNEYFNLWKKCEDKILKKEIMKATLTIGIGTDYPVELSMRKCKLIIDNLIAVKSFINHNA